MIPRINEIKVLEKYRLLVRFDDGKCVEYDVADDVETIPSFAPLYTEPGLFENLTVDESRTCVSWSKEIDLASDSIYEYGKCVNA